MGGGEYLQMITVSHKGGPENDYGIWWILGEYKRNNISIDVKKISYFSVFIFGGMLNWLHYYMIALLDGGL